MFLQQIWHRTAQYGTMPCMPDVVSKNLNAPTPFVRFKSSQWSLSIRKANVSKSGKLLIHRRILSIRRPLSHRGLDRRGSCIRGAVASQMVPHIRMSDYHSRCRCCSSHCPSHHRLLLLLLLLQAMVDLVVFPFSLSYC